MANESITAANTALNALGDISNRNKGALNENGQMMWMETDENGVSNQKTKQVVFLW
jgi:hypothetical protein